MTTPIILDCDPGNDDALGILAAFGSPGLAVQAITSGAGHLAADRTARNAAITVAMAGAGDVPVAAGAAEPLVRERLVAGVLDMQTGLDPERSDLRGSALCAATSAETIVSLAERTRGLTMVTTGPLTNLALALRLRPAIAAHLRRIVMLGGAWGLGNKTAAAEWNVLCDPEAAAIVFGAGVPLTLIPIDAASQVMIDDELLAAVEALQGRVAAFAGELMRSLRSTFRPGHFGPGDMPLNDPLATLVAADSALARVVPARVDVELAGRHTYGRTVIDFAGKSGLPPNCDVAIGFDVPATRNAFIAAITRCGHRAAPS